MVWASTQLAPWRSTSAATSGGVAAGGGAVTVIDDYAHHPVEIRAVLSAAREAVAGYGSAAVMGESGYLAPAQLEHAGLEGAMLMARALVG